MYSQMYSAARHIPGNYSSSGLEAKVASAANSYSVRETCPAHAYEATKPYVVLDFQHSSLSYDATAADSGETAPGQGQSERVTYHPQPVTFLNPNRQRTPFVGEAVQISHWIEEAFRETAGSELPADIAITVASRTTLQQIHRQFLKTGVTGLSINGKLREIFVVSGSLDEVMLVIGHELGHVITPSLPDARAEEAKAFAFEHAWAKTIFSRDVAGLKNSINSAAFDLKPARNGLHDLAFAFVKSQTATGKDPLKLHAQLSEKGSLETEEVLIIQSEQPPGITSASASYTPLTGKRSYGGYLNRSRVQNVPWFSNFTWTDLGKGVYGMYIPLTASIFMNEALLKSDLEQFHKTLGHEYVLHHVMQLPDGYVTEILEQTIFWIDDKEDRYKR